VTVNHCEGHTKGILAGLWLGLRIRTDVGRDRRKGLYIRATSTYQSRSRATWLVTFERTRFDTKWLRTMTIQKRVAPCPRTTVHRWDTTPRNHMCWDPSNTRSKVTCARTRRILRKHWVPLAMRGRATSQACSGYRCTTHAHAQTTREVRQRAHAANKGGRGVNRLRGHRQTREKSRTCGCLPNSLSNATLIAPAYLHMFYVHTARPTTARWLPMLNIGLRCT
jgi:hypothetical protein